MNRPSRHSDDYDFNFQADIDSFELYARTEERTTIAAALREQATHLGLCDFGATQTGLELARYLRSFADNIESGELQAHQAFLEMLGK